MVTAKIKYYLVIYISLILAFSQEAKSVTIEVAPGSLAKSLDGLAADLEILKIRGQIDARDFESLTSLPASIKTLDLSELWISQTFLPDGSDGVYDEGKLTEGFFISSTFDNVLLPKNLKEVSDGMFAGSKLKTVTLPSACTVIGKYAFYDCGALKEINFGENPVSIEEGAFAKCMSLKNIDLPAGSKLAGAEIFSGSGITNLDLSEVDYTSDYAAAGMPALFSVTLNAEGETGNGILMSNPNLSYILGDIDYVAPYMALGSKADKVYGATNSSYEIGDYAFASTQIKDVYFSKNLALIGDGAFSYSQLKTIDATSLGSSLPYATNKSFEGLDPEKIDVYVTSESYNAWKNDPFWGNFNIIAGASGVGSPTTDHGLKITADSRNIYITSSDKISNYAIVSLNGISLANGQTEETSIEIPCSEWNERIVVVKVWDETKSYNTSLLLK